MKDLIPVRQTMKAANHASINIDSAILILLSGDSANGSHYDAAAMVYISPDAKWFFLSKHVMIQLGIIPNTFPQIGAACSESQESAAISASDLSKQDCHTYPENAEFALVDVCAVNSLQESLNGYLMNVHRTTLQKGNNIS